MARLGTKWRVAAAIFTVINVAGAVYAFVQGEMMHGATHVALIFGTVVAWQVFSSPNRQENDGVIPQLDSQLDSQIEQLQHSVDAIALEVERIGEGQRFINKLQQEEVERQPLKRSEPPAE